VGGGERKVETISGVRNQISVAYKQVHIGI